MFTLNCKGKLLVADKPLVMGIINTTPDSFYAGSRKTVAGAILAQGEAMMREGASILDIGGQSTRPGSDRVSAEEELRRVIPAIEMIHRALPDTVISIDTYYSEVAREAVAAGASMVNDISAGSIDSKMFTTVAALGVPYVLMHMKGTPQTMQQEANYSDVTSEVLEFFIQKADAARSIGISDIILDPGFGFAKTAAHNFELLRNLGSLRIAGCPLLVGLSRKATIYKTLGITPEESLNGTTVMNTIGLMHGADILRVHDVREAREAIELAQRMSS